ncbi:hypothetical protein RKD37_005931 [Streptomyces ambofaciens]
MPGTNLTREEARQRATLLTVDSYEIDLDLTGAQEGGTYRSVTTVRFDVAEGGGESFIDLVAPTVHEVTLNGDALDPAEVFQDSRIALPGLLPGRNVLRVARGLRVHQHRRGPAPVRRPGGRPGVPVHAVRGAGRAPRLRELRAAGPEGDVPVHREGPRGLDGHLQLADARTEGQRLGVRADPAHLVVHHGADRRPVPLGAQRVREGRPVRAARHLLPSVAGRAPRRGRDLRGHPAGLRLVPGEVRLPVPVQEVRPALRAGVQRGRDGERGRGDHPGPVRVPLQGDGRRVRGAGGDDPARAGAHVVRRPGHHGVVERPVAERVVRHLCRGRLPGPPRRGRSGRTRGRRSPTR